MDHTEYTFVELPELLLGFFKAKDQSTNSVDVFLWFSFVSATDDNQYLIKL